MKNFILVTIALLVLGAAVWAGRATAPAVQAPAATAAAPAAERKILYYRNPMGLADTSPVPKKDNMGMDYIPVYAGEDTRAGEVSLSPARVQTTGVRTEAAAMRLLQQQVHAVGVIEADERSVATVAPRFEGWIETLAVAETGRRIRRGEPLFTAYSPELVAVQQEYLLALQARRAQPGPLADELLAAARARMLNWQVDPADIRRLEQTGSVQRALVFRAPVDGEVLEKPATAGMRFMPGEMLYRIADLGTVWLQASVYEQDLARVRPGQAVKLRVDAFPAEDFDGVVGLILPELDAATRTARLRIELDNADRRLRPGMFGSVELQVSASEAPVLSVPDSALLDSGTRQHVLVQLGEGLFEPREVVAGRRGADYVEIRSGLVAGEQVVVSANFLIDAESNLKAALEGFAPTAGEHAQHAAQPEQEKSAEHADHADHANHAAPQGEHAEHGGHAGHDGHGAQDEQGEQIDHGEHTGHAGAHEEH